MSGLRHRAGVGSPAKQYESDTQKTKLRHAVFASNRYGVAHFLGLITFIATILYAVYVSGAYLPAGKDSKALPTEFSAARARKHLLSLTKLGSRPSGSYENDVLAAEYIMEQASLIKDKALPEFSVEYEIQTPTGSLAFARQHGFCLTGVYQNMTNVVVRLSPKNAVSKDAILVNAHFDTVPKTEGASDDAVSCAVMLEALRALSQTAGSLKHSIVMLFNGAEEGALMGSHGFVAQHRWMADVRMVVNLEAAGSGSQEFVFQTGPENPWMLETYASAAKYPFASIIAQDIFQTDMIPSDTDFRVFRVYGNLSGIDMAFAKNGYVYHTRYDDAKSIPDGSIQHAGDNVFALLKELSHSPFLQDPGDYRHGDTVFFDVLGVFLVHYPKRLQMFLNKITTVLVLVYIAWAALFRKPSPQKGTTATSKLEPTSLGNILMSGVLILISWLCAILSPVLVAFAVMKLGYSMSWYSSPSFGMALYALPAVVGLMVAYLIGAFVLEKISYISIRSFLFAHLLLFTSFVMFLTHLSVGSSFLFWLWLAFPFTFTCLPLDLLEMIPDMRHHGIYLLHIFGSAIPATLTAYQLQLIHVFFLPLFGRIGTDLPTDLVLAALWGVTVVLVISVLMPLYLRSQNMKRLLVIMFMASCIPFLYLFTGKIHPYSVSDPITPKRLEMQHTQRTFYNSDGSIQKQDVGLFLQPQDYLKMKYIESVPFYKDAFELPCEGAYCGLPFYYGKRKIYRKQWFLHGDQLPADKVPLTTSIYRRENLGGNRVRFHFEIQDFVRVNVFLSPKPGVVLSDWSFYSGVRDSNGRICSTPDYAGSYAHMIFYSRGYYCKESWKFWIELQTDSSSDADLAEIGFARHYLSGKDSMTPYLRKAIAALPKFVCDQAWTSNYDSFLLR